MRGKVKREVRLILMKKEKKSKRLERLERNEILFRLDIETFITITLNR